MSLAKQVEYRAIAERLAYANTRVVSFSQYLLRDSNPTGPLKSSYGGFESGLRFADGKPKPSLAAFRLPLAVQRVGSPSARVWGLRAAHDRRERRATSPTPTAARRTFQPLRTVQSPTPSATTTFTATLPYSPGRRWNVTWQNLSGSPVERLHPRSKAGAPRDQHEPVPQAQRRPGAEPKRSSAPTARCARTGRRRHE